MLREIDQQTKNEMAFNENWRDEFAKRLDRNERKESQKFKRYLKKEYETIIDLAVQQNSIPNSNPYFKLNEIKDLYVNLYSDIGTDFALWYEKNFEKFLKKSNTDVYRESFAAYGAKQAGKKIVIVRDTALKQIRTVMKGIFDEDEFQREGKIAQSRILKRKFNQISSYQAERIVRTETTAAANYAIMQSATTMFDKNSLVKEWSATNDARTRSFLRGDKADHVNMDGVVINFDEDFKVPKIGGTGFDLMSQPADPRGSAANVINCRCAVAVYPKEDADIREGVELEGFGGTLARGTTTDLFGTQRITQTPPIDAIDPVVDDVLEGTLMASTIEEAGKKAQSILKNAGLDIKDGIQISPKMTAEKFQKYNKEISRLSKKYDLSGEKNSTKNVQLKFMGSSTTYGSVWRFRGRGHKRLTEIDFGHTTGKIDRQLRKKFDGEYNYFGKSQVDLNKNDIATVTHEFAHIISKNVAPNSFAAEIEKNYWKEVRKIKRQYDKELRQYSWRSQTPDPAKFNEIYLGNYASTNMDEFHAEAFTEFELNSNPSKYAKLIGELIIKYFKK